MYHSYIYHICNVHVFTSPKRSKLNDVGLKVVQSSCTVTSKIKSTTAFLSVSTASLKPISVMRQQMQAITKHFAALDFYGFLSHTYEEVCSGQARDRFLGLMGSEMRSICTCTQNPRLLGLSQTLGGAAALLKRMAGNGNGDHECHMWLYYMLHATDRLFSIKCFQTACKLWLRHPL